MRPVVSLDMTRQLADISLDNVRARRVAGGARAEQAMAAALRAGAAMLAAEQVGLADRALEITLAYVNSGTSSPGRSVPSRRSSTGWRTGGLP